MSITWNVSSISDASVFLKGRGQNRQDEELRQKEQQIRDLEKKVKELEDEIFEVTVLTDEGKK